MGSLGQVDAQAQDSQVMVRQAQVDSQRTVTPTLGRQGRAMAQQLLIRATPAAQATLALTATGQGRAMVDQTATEQPARVAATVETGVDLRQTSRMGRTPLLLEVALVLSMVLGPLVATEEALRLISHLVLWVRVQTAIRQQALAYCAAVKDGRDFRVTYHFIVLGRS